MDPKEVEYLRKGKEPYVDWMNNKKYSPDRAEQLRVAARENPRWGGYKLFHSEES
jgi:hypothetical protein